MHAILARISPQGGSSGLRALETEHFSMTCHQTPTGIKFVVFSDPAFGMVELFLRRLHELYADYAMKNPFYTPGMPVRCDRFDSELARLCRSYNASNATATPGTVGAPASAAP